MFFVTGVGYINRESFVKDDVRYPRNWLHKQSEEQLSDFGAVKEPVVDSKTTVVEAKEDGWFVRDKTQDELNQDAESEQAAVTAEIHARVSEAWSAADALAAQIDHNARPSILWYAIEEDTPQWRKDRILAVRQWWNNLWDEYERVMLLIKSGEPITFDPSVVGDSPYTVWGIKYE